MIPVAFYVSLFVYQKRREAGVFISELGNFKEESRSSIQLTFTVPFFEDPDDDPSITAAPATSVRRTTTAEQVAGGSSSYISEGPHPPEDGKNAHLIDLNDTDDELEPFEKMNGTSVLPKSSVHEQLTDSDDDLVGDNVNNFDKPSLEKRLKQNNF